MPLRWVVGLRNSIFVAHARERLGEVLLDTYSLAGPGRFLGELEGQTEECVARDAVLDPAGTVAHVDSIGSLVRRCRDAGSGQNPLLRRHFGLLIGCMRIRRVASALVIPGGSIPRRRDSRRATTFCARVRPAVPAAPDSPLVRRARLRPQMARRRVGCALHIASAAAGLSPLRHCGNTLAPTPTRDYAPSLHSPWRAATEVSGSGRR